MIKHILIYLIIFVSCLSAQQLRTPLEINNYEKLTSYEELVDFLYQAVKESDILEIELPGRSIAGRNIFALKFSNSEFGEDDTKLKILILAQQHGNEQSGKEGALLLIKELLKDENTYLFDKIDFILIPLVNPDGAEKNQRRNGNGMDLNRNHLILTEPETIALHNLFDKYLFEVTMDVHEYWPFGREWKKLGFRKNFDVTVGAITNINISDKIRNLSYKSYLPFIFNFISESGYSVFHYLPGGPVGLDYIRFSTFDINDGRQSFGIQHTFSFIQEGMNGEDYSTDNIENRAKSQMIAMFGLLKYCYDNKEEIKNLISEERKILIENKVSEKVAIQLDHYSDGTKLELPILSYHSNQDTVVKVDDFRSVVKPLYEVIRPKGYLIPKSLKEVVDWADRHKLTYYDYKISENDKIEQYFIRDINSIDFERDTIVNPVVEVKPLENNFIENNYIFIPVNQIKNNMIVIALEPKSMLGLVTYRQFEHLLKAGERYPILRVIN